MNSRFQTYTAYSIAASAGVSSSKRHDILIVFGGFVIGWLSATIARAVYPPPKKYQHGDRLRDLARRTQTTMNRSRIGVLRWRPRCPGSISVNSVDDAPR